MLRSLPVLLALLAAPALAAYPDKPVRIIVPYVPGGNIDITARTLAPGLGEALGQTIVVENRGGAGGTIGTEIAAKAPADGYTLLLGSSGTLTNAPALYPKLGYDPLKDFATTSMTSVVPIVLEVHPSVPAKTRARVHRAGQGTPRPHHHGVGRQRQQQSSGRRAVPECHGHTSGPRSIQGQRRRAGRSDGRPGRRLLRPVVVVDQLPASRANCARSR